MKRLAPEWMAHPVQKRFVLAMATAASVLVSTPVEAQSTESNFAELRGVPEQIGVHALDLDWCWSWSWLGLIVLVVALIAADRLRSDKLKRQERDE